MKIIELVLDQENVYGVDAISIVSAPAISEHFVTLKEDEPEIVNSDPYGKGWMIKIKIADQSELNDLLSEEAYSNLIQ